MNTDDNCGNSEHLESLLCFTNVNKNSCCSNELTFTDVIKALDLHL